MKIQVCIGSSCHLKGSKTIVETLQREIRDRDLGDKVNLEGIFCMGRCAEGVGVKVDDVFYSVSPETVDSFFSETVLSALS